MSVVPVPKDIPLPLPLPGLALQVIAVLLFLVHIVFVNLMVGGSLITLVFEAIGWRKPAFDRLAREIASTITVNKSLAVVMGIGPLLCMNVYYTVYFYAANTLTGNAWIAVVPLAIIAFLLTYAHKYSWDSLKNFPVLHWSINLLATLIFLFIPFIFLANINLMLFPEHWREVAGFFSTLKLPNVFPRYFHFICASVALTGLFLVHYFQKAIPDFDVALSPMTRADCRRRFYSIALGASCFQFVIGPIVLYTLPVKGFSWSLVGLIATGAAFALPAMWWMWREMTGPDSSLGKRYWPIVGLMTVTVVLMGTGRHFYRETALASHRQLVAEKTRSYTERAEAARREEEARAAAQEASESEGSQ